MSRRLLLSLVIVCAWTTLAQSGSPHFTSCAVVVSGTTLTAEGKEAGLGNESQVHIVLTADAACINPGGQDPKAANKDAVTAEGTFPVQNGKALFSLEATASFQPECAPPMSVTFSNITVCDVDHDVCCSLD
jgi:hypothetical protein